ncbi:hypothetical protein OPT61_g4042 [Boeremia exigua]|uniref:Uncharacterized protein n=1 Tax=Boeremia exigua TaxID=749465 RepID=A0ACC2IFM8_9PLEO|nr:hypothetical protein OPT61_g4042 [Boeremia exigua]
MIDRKTSPDPGVVGGLEASKLPVDPLLLARLVVEMVVSFLHVESRKDWEKMCNIAVWHVRDAQDARMMRLWEPQDGVTPVRRRVDDRPSIAIWGLMSLAQDSRHEVQWLFQDPR